MKYLVVVLFFFLPLFSFAAGPTVGANTSTSAGVAAGTSDSWTHTVEAGTTMLVVGYTTYTAVGNGGGFTVTYGGTTMTQDFRNNDHIDVAQFYLANPPVGAATVAVSWINSGAGSGGAMDVLGSATTLDTTGTGNSNISASPATDSITTVANNSLIIATVGVLSTSPTAGQTLVWTNNAQASKDINESFLQATAGPKSMTATFTGSVLWSMSVSSFKPAVNTFTPWQFSDY